MLNWANDLLLLIVWTILNIIVSITVLPSRLNILLYSRCDFQINTYNTVFVDCVFVDYALCCIKKKLKFGVRFVNVFEELLEIHVLLQCHMIPQKSH